MQYHYLLVKPESNLVNIILLLLYRQGSVIADVVLTFTTSLGESEVDALLSAAAQDNKIGDLPVGKVVTGEFIETKKQSEECGTFFEGEDCKKGAYLLNNHLFHLE